MSQMNGEWKTGHICNRSDLKRKDLCYKCKENWEPGHICGERSQICNIEAIPEEEAEGNPNKKTKYNEGDLKSIQSKEERTINN